jgi:hypothetical protein
MTAIMIIGAVAVMIVSAVGLVRFTLSGKPRGMDATYARHGHNMPAHITGHPGYELSDYEAFTRAILKARMITHDQNDHSAS